MTLSAVLGETAGLWDGGYSALDIITTLFRVSKTMQLEEQVKLNVIKEIGFAHVRVVDGCDTLLQLSGLCARLCNL